jgi:Tol biopolymer transport system component
MAEYLSLGPRSSQTAMWLRDAAIENRLPTLDRLDDPRYFPYRFGHAWWAYVGGRHGDRVIGEIMRALVPTGGGVNVAAGGDAAAIFESVFGQKRDEISTAWHAAIRDAYGVIASPTPRTPPTDYVALGFRTGSGSLNVGPSLSPDGKKLAFLSARDLLSIDLYLADADTGKILRRLVQTAGDPHFESLQFLASAGTWAPDNRRLAIATVRQGRPALAIIDTDNANVLEEIKFPAYGEIFQPSWSPDGKSIAFSAQTGGVTDLHVYDLTTKQARQLTHDGFADLQPTWAPDGKQIVFVTERYRGTLANLDFKGLSLAIIDVAGGAPQPLETGLAPGREIDPKWSADGRTLFFISDERGKPNIYRLTMGTGRASQVTDFRTGIAGITPTSPAISIASAGSRVAMSIFVNGGFEIQFADASRLTPLPLEPQVRDEAALPPMRRESSVATELASAERDLPAAATFTEEPAKSGFGLVGVGAQAGGATSGAFGTYVSGGIAFQFSDVLGNHVVGMSFDVNGGVRDIGASVSYLNRTRRWNWGVFGEHIPITSGQIAANVSVVNGRPVYVEQTQIYRQTYTQTGALIAYPFSRTSRVELSSSLSRIGFSGEIQSNYFDYNTGDFLGDTTEDLPGEPPIHMYDMKVAYVRDSATMGPVGPVVGQRFRAEFAPTGGDLRMNNVTIDFRHYAMPFRPVTFAIRALHVGRYGEGGEDERLVPMFLGYSTYVRGYDPNSFGFDECTVTLVGTCQEFDDMEGSRVIVINAEARIPLMGLAGRRMDYGPIPVELFGFFDAGQAWTSFIKPSFARGPRDWVTSAGLGARVNAMGFAIVELNLARPLNRANAGWQFVFNLRPGW